MNIDVIINSCARIDVLPVAVKTFKKRIKTDHDLRYVLLEDKVEDEKRQALGKAWLKENNDLFDKIVYSDFIMGPWYFWQGAVNICTTDYMLHLEDDVDFQADLEIDSALDFMHTNEKDVVEVIFWRDPMHPSIVGKTLKSDNLTEFKSFSIASGLYNLRLVKKILDSTGWNAEMHETGVLLPAANKLNLRRYILGRGSPHYTHVGGQLNYIKGDWKSDN